MKKGKLPRTPDGRKVGHNPPPLPNPAPMHPDERLARAKSRVKVRNARPRG